MNNFKIVFLIVRLYGFNHKPNRNRVHLIFETVCLSSSYSITNYWSRLKGKKILQKMHNFKRFKIVNIFITE